MQVALMPLDLVSIQALLLSHSTHSVKLPFFQKATAVITLIKLEYTITRKQGRMLKNKRVFQQTLPPHFCLKVVCKYGGGGGGHIFRSLQYKDEYIQNLQKNSNQIGNTIYIYI